MSKEAALPTVIVGLVVAFAIGFVTGRRFPPHNYAVASSAGKIIVLVDTTTGKVCSPTRNLVEDRVTQNTVLSPDAADPAKLADQLQKQSESFDSVLGPRCPE
jgi:hypothetical protein